MELLLGYQMWKTNSGYSQSANMLLVYRCTWQNARSIGRGEYRKQWGPCPNGTTDFQLGVGSQISLVKANSESRVPDTTRLHCVTAGTEKPNKESASFFAL